jgi:lysozyme
MSFDRAALKRDIRTAEALRRCAYDDATSHDIVPGYTVQGHITIGYGRRIDLPLSNAAIDFLMEEDIQNCCDALDIALPWWRNLAEPQQRAVVELAFTAGVQGVLRFHRLLAALKNGDGEQAARELADSRWTKQVHQRRSVRVQNLLRNTTVNAD